MAHQPVGVSRGLFHQPFGVSRGFISRIGVSRGFRPVSVFRGCHGTDLFMTPIQANTYRQIALVERLSYYPGMLPSPRLRLSLAIQIASWERGGGEGPKSKCPDASLILQVLSLSLHPCIASTS